jgi:hypothetical protein
VCLLMQAAKEMGGHTQAQPIAAGSPLDLAHTSIASCQKGASPSSNSSSSSSGSDGSRRTLYSAVLEAPDVAAGVLSGQQCRWQQLRCRLLAQQLQAASTGDVQLSDAFTRVPADRFQTGSAIPLGSRCSLSGDSRGGCADGVQAGDDCSDEQGQHWNAATGQVPQACAGDAAGCKARCPADLCCSRCSWGGSSVRAAEWAEQAQGCHFEGPLAASGGHLGAVPAARVFVGDVLQDDCGLSSDEE